MNLNEIINDFDNRPSRGVRVEYIFCASCGGVHYTTIDAQECECGDGRPRNNRGEDLHRVVRPRKVR